MALRLRQKEASMKYLVTEFNEALAHNERWFS